ncbi:MAG: GTPase HflX [Chloroflexi bacterium]|nr:GTPase HflX [Chloroflexota bacterium]
MPKGPLPVRTPAEKALLVAVDATRERTAWTAESSLEELARLAGTAGAEVVGKVIQRLPVPTHDFYVGTGKMEELAQLKATLGYDTVILDSELTPLQQRNLENALRVKIIDRTALILDIFAKHARTREGRLQVELAQHQYLLPRLAGQWSHLERLGGGIGTRGPGETQLETDRRLIRLRIQRLKKQIEEIRSHRRLYRRRRSRHGVPVVALVGYTNAGKSTLLNALTGANVLVEDKLFATLDPVTRRLRLPKGNEVLITDTVGFIQQLPPTVVAAFRATLEELEEASLLLHIVDITHENAVEQSHTVEQVLNELGLADKPRLLVLNKADLLTGGDPKFGAGPGRDRGPEALSTIVISAARGWELERLLELIAIGIEPVLAEGKVSPASRG